MDNPLVSVICITYNHEKYIKDAIDSFLSQRTNFDYEIIIHDDASTDNTADIIRQYEKKYPNKIHGIYQKKNQFSQKKKIVNDYAYPRCKGKYIALCEGDDYWIDTNKLQIQVDFMESHSECMMLAHDAICIDYMADKVYPMHPYYEDKYLSEDEVIIQYHGDVPTASTMYRKEAAVLKDFFAECRLGDYAYELHAITKGRIYYSSRIMSVYRSMHEGSWCRTHKDNLENGILLYGNVINFLREYNNYTNCKYSQAIIYKESLFIEKSVRKCRQAGIIQIGEFVQRCNVSSDNQYEKFLTQLEIVYRQTFEEDYCSASIKVFAKQYDHIYIWGAGEYGQKMAKQLRNNDITFEAFLISNPSQKKEIMGKQIIGINEIPYPVESVGIIVAVNLKIWDELREQFELGGQFNYIYPYGVTEVI